MAIPLTELRGSTVYKTVNSTNQSDFGLSSSLFIRKNNRSAFGNICQMNHYLKHIV